jgi:MoxR-like ATPase
MSAAEVHEPASSDVELLEKARESSRKLRSAIAVRVVGQDEVIELMLVALLARGHALLVGVPGLAKTLLVASLAEALDLSFGRVQFTPDLLPADITGTDVLQDDAGGRVVRFLPGPIFHNLVLADEINRTPPKTQAALLQAMQERRVTVGMHTHALPGTRSSRKGRTRCPKRSSIGSSSRCTSTIRAPSRSARSRVERRGCSREPSRAC